MSGPCNTIKIKATTGSYPYSVINESDFDAEKHTLYSEFAVPAEDNQPEDHHDTQPKQSRRGAK